MKCSQADAFVHAYVDGELAGVDRDSYEQHLVECGGCSHASRLQARFKAAVRGHLSPPAVPERLRQTITVAIAKQPPIRKRWLWDSYPRLAPAAAAAAMLLVVIGTARNRRSPMLVEQALRNFQAGVPMDVIDSNCAALADWFRGKVPFSVPTPAIAARGTCQGGRLVNSREGFGAYFQLQMADNHRVGMTVFHTEDDDGPLDGAERRMLGGREVYIGRSRGATTASYRDRDGRYYILTGDLDEGSLSNIVEASLHQRN